MRPPNDYPSPALHAVPHTAVVLARLCATLSSGAKVNLKQLTELVENEHAGSHREGEIKTALRVLCIPIYSCQRCLSPFGGIPEDGAWVNEIHIESRHPMCELMEIVEWEMGGLEPYTLEELEEAYIYEDDLFKKDE